MSYRFNVTCIVLDDYMTTTSLYIVWWNST